MIKAFLISFILSLGLFITIGNINQANASLNRSEKIIKDIKKQADHLEILKNYYKM